MASPRDGFAGRWLLARALMPEAAQTPVAGTIHSCVEISITRHWTTSSRLLKLESL